MTEDIARAMLEDRIAAAQRRNAPRLAESAARVRDNVVGFVTAHPFLTVAGAIAAGLALGSLHPRVRNSRLSKRAATLTALATDAVLDQARRTWGAAQEAGHTGREQIGEIGDTVMDTASRMSQEVGRFTEEAARSAKKQSRHTRESARELVSEIGSRFRH